MAWEDFTNFTSSNIASLRYDTGSATLEVGFQNGGIYQYYDVPEHVWEGFKVADSQGVYLHEHVKGYYRYSKV